MFENKEEDKEYFRPWLRSHLNYGEVKVTFLKKDNTERVMRCTTNQDMTPAYVKKTERVMNEDVCFVYDLDKKEWRSFRFDTVTSVEF